MRREQLTLLCKLKIPTSHANKRVTDWQCRVQAELKSIVSQNNEARCCDNDINDQPNLSVLSGRYWTENFGARIKGWMWELLKDGQTTHSKQSLSLEIQLHVLLCHCNAHLLDSNDNDSHNENKFTIDVLQLVPHSRGVLEHHKLQYWLMSKSTFVALTVWMRLGCAAGALCNSPCAWFTHNVRHIGSW